MIICSVDELVLSVTLIQLETHRHHFFYYSSLSVLAAFHRFRDPPLFLTMILLITCYYQSWFPSSFFSITRAMLRCSISVAWLPSRSFFVESMAIRFDFFKSTSFLISIIIIRLRYSAFYLDIGSLGFFLLRSCTGCRRTGNEATRACAIHRIALHVRVVLQWFHSKNSSRLIPSLYNTFPTAEILYYLLYVRNRDRSRLSKGIHCRPPLFFVFTDNGEDFAFPERQIIGILEENEYSEWIFCWFVCFLSVNRISEYWNIGWW